MEASFLLQVSSFFSHETVSFREEVRPELMGYMSKWKENHIKYNGFSALGYNFSPVKILGVQKASVSEPGSKLGPGGVPKMLHLEFHASLDISEDMFPPQAPLQ